MGTNYYLYENDNICKHCGRYDEDTVLHIGKSSYGWCFSLHVIPESNINSLDDWKKLFEQEDKYIIKNEYDEKISKEKMLEIIEKRVGNKPFDERNWDNMLFNSGKTEQYFHDTNLSERGPNNLLRSRIGPETRCLGHGDGPYDLIEGLFS